MKTVQFPRICPFGSENDEEVVTLRLPSAKSVLWSLNKDHFLRVNVYDDGDVTYFMGTRGEVQDDLLDWVSGLEAWVEFDQEDAEARLRKLRFTRLLKAITKAKAANAKPRHAKTRPVH